VRHLVPTPRKTGYYKSTLVLGSHGTLAMSELPVKTGIEEAKCDKGIRCQLPELYARQLKVNLDTVENFPDIRKGGRFVLN
jgi:hypothetical protein